jgi:uncharacterized protein (DUF1800 family)
MAFDPKGAALALHRFGFGPRAVSIAAIASDPRGALLAELDRPPPVPAVARSDLMASGAANRAVFEFNAERNAMARLERKRREAVATAGMDPAAVMNEAIVPAPMPAQPEVPLPRRIFLAEAKARIEAAVHAEVGLVERLVWFWSNHFCVNANNTVMAGAYEREAIRPHVLGRFADMLLAAEGHPAMLLYLDNAQSIGPSSVAGINRDRGLNENLAREILELHTLGVRTVYTQEDVTSFAKVLTGWTIYQTATNPDHGGEFLFNRRMHEPGPQTVIGKLYQDTGVEQGRAVLADLARHEATATHLARKLARHFISDEPPPALVEQLARRYRETDGDLKEVARALIMSSEAWAPERAKIKRPGEWMMAGLRAAGINQPDMPRVVQATVLMGEPLWRPPAPRGFSDDNSVWLDGLAQRLAIANVFGQRVGERLNPEAVVEVALGPLASTETRRLIAGAESKPQAFAFLLMSPEFQRR